MKPGSVASGLSRVFSLAVVLMMGGFAVGADQKPPATAPSEPKPLTAEQLRAAPDRVTIQEIPLYLSAWLGQHYPPGEQLRIDFHVLPVDRDHPKMPKEVFMEKIWLVAGDEIWTMEVERPKKDDAFGASNMAEEGNIKKGWAWGTKVQVIVRLRDEKGEKHLIRAAAEVSGVVP